MYTTRELTPETWPDFERLFSRGHGWDHCWCTAFQEDAQAPTRQFRTRAQKSVVNHQVKQELVALDRAHGILVYAGELPTGWCQFGPASELRAHYRAPANDVQWRITCFVVDRQHRRRGVAGLALRAALEAIRSRGGGLIEAYPVAAWSHGRGRCETAVHIPGAGDVAPAWGGFGNVSTPGTVSMFQRQGFSAVGVCGSNSARVRNTRAAGCQVVMHKVI